MTGHTYRTIDVPVAGGDLRVAVWDPAENADTAPSVLLVHGVTSSHLAWSWVIDRLPGIRAIAPDLRGRGASNGLEGPAGMRAHAQDLAAVLETLDVDRILVVGHSMGAFVAVVFADLYPDLVSRLVLVDGGLPLDAPAGLDPADLAAAILGPTLERLSKRYADVEAYLDFWRMHPGFQHDWSPLLERYIAYDLVDDGGGALRPATSHQVTIDDTMDLNTGTAVPDALSRLRHPTRFITVPLGLQNEPPGLYSPERLEQLLTVLPVDHRRYEGFNHYTIVMSDAGADEIGAIALEELKSAHVA